MKIVIDNISDGEVLNYPILLIRGKIENVDTLSLDEYGNESISSKGQIFLTHTSDGHRDKEYLQSIPVQYFGDTVAKFKFLLPLKIGINYISLEYFRIRRSLTIRFRPEHQTQNHLIKLLYIVCADSEGDFQSPYEEVNVDIETNNGGKDNRPTEKNDVASAKKRISLAASIIQCILAESLEVHGFGRRTIQFYGDDSKEKSKDFYFPYPDTHVFKSRLTTSEVYKMDQRQLWEYHAKEVISSEPSGDSQFGNQKLKYIAIHSATRYTCNSEDEVAVTHAEVLARTKGHASIGGGDFALIGSGCLHTWPENLCDVISTFENTTKIDSLKFMDDSAYRKTIGGCFATTLGSLIHELGHTFDLGHANNGFMARGFDDIDKFFTLSSKTSRSENTYQTPTLCCMTSHNDQSNPSSFCNTSSPILAGAISKGTSYLEQYQQKQYYRRMQNEFGNAFWDKSSATILSAHKWLNVSASIEVENRIKYSSNIKSIQCNGSTFLLLEFRDKNDNILDFVDLSGKNCDFIDLCPYIKQLGSKFNTFLCISCDGELLKTQI